MARNVCMNKICDNTSNICKSSLFGTDVSVNYVETYITSKSFYNGVNYLPSSTEKENLTVMSNVKNNTPVKKNYKGLSLNDMENDLSYKNSISFGSAICGLKCEDSFKENSKLHNSQKGLKCNQSDNCEEQDSGSYRPCFIPSSSVLPPSGHMSKTCQNYVSEKPVYEMVADSLTFSPFQERKSSVVRLASEGNVARSTLVDVNYTSSKSGKCTGHEKEFSKRLCKFVKSITEEYNSDITTAKTCLELGASITKGSVISDTLESITKYCDENKDSCYSVPLKLNEVKSKSKQVNLCKSDSCLDFRFSGETLKGSLSLKSLKDNDVSPKKPKAKKKYKKTESSGFITQNQNFANERDMPQLIPLSDVSDEVRASENMELDDDDGIVNVPDSPEMPVLIPFTSENEEPLPNKIEDCSSLDYTVTPVPSLLSKVRSPKGKVKNPKGLPKKTICSKTQTPFKLPPKGPLYLNYNNIFQPKVILPRLSEDDIKRFCKGNSVKDTKLCIKANCMKKKTVRKVCKKKYCAKKFNEKDKSVRGAEQKFDKNVRSSTEKKCDRVKTDPISKKNCENIKEIQDVDEKPLCELKSEDKNTEASGDAKKDDNIESVLKVRSHNEKDQTSPCADLKEVLTESSEDPEVDVIDGINFFSFHSKKSMDEFSETHGGTFTYLFDVDEFDSNDSFGEHVEMIYPTKTKDITQIKGWRKKYFAPETSFIKNENCMNVSVYLASDIDEDSLGRPEAFFSQQVLSSTPVSTSSEVVKPIERVSKSELSKSAFISDALENFLKNESKLQVSFLEKVNPNILPIPPNASILSLGSLRKFDRDSTPHLNVRQSKILNSKNSLKQFEGDTSESSFDTTTNSDDWNSPGKETPSESGYSCPSKVSRQEKYATPVPKKKIKFGHHEEILNPQRLVLKLQKHGCGSTDGYKVADISNASTDTEDPSLNKEIEGPIKECADGCPLPLVQKTMFTCETDKKLLLEFLDNLNSCEKDLDTINRKSNKVHFDCPVITEKHIRKASSSVPHLASVKSLVKKTNYKTKKPVEKVVTSPKPASHSLVSHATKLANISSGNLNLCTDPRGKRRIRLPARYLDSALMVTGNEWVSPVSDNFDIDNSKKLKKRKIDCVEETDSSGDILSEENIREQFPNAKWSSENVLNSNTDADASLSLVSSTDGCSSDCWSVSCSRTLIYSVFSKKLLCKCEEPKINEEIFSKKIAKSLRSKHSISASTSSVTTVVSIGDDHSYSSRERVETKPASGDKSGSLGNDCNQTASKNTESVPCSSEERKTDLQTTEKIQLLKSAISLPSTEDSKKPIGGISLQKEESCVQKLNKELSNNLNSVSNSPAISKNTVSQNSVLKEVQPNLLKTVVSSDVQNTLSRNEATNSLLVSNVNDTVEKSTSSVEQVLKVSAEKDVVKSVSVSSPERSKYALVLVPVKSPVGSQQNCIQGKYFKVANSPAKLPPNVSVLSSTSLSVLKKCSAPNSADGVNLLTKSGNAHRAIGTVSVGNLKTQLLLNTLQNNINSSNAISSSSVLSTNSIQGNSVKPAFSQELPQNTLASSSASNVIPDILHGNDMLKHNTSVCSSFPLNSGENVTSLPTSCDNQLPKLNNTSMAGTKTDAKLVPEKSSLKHIQLTSLKLGNKVVLYPNKSVMNVKLMNNSSLSNKPCSPSTNSNSLSNSEQVSAGPTVVMVSPSPVKNTSLSGMDTTSSTSLHSIQKIVDVSETVSHNSNSAANENSNSGGGLVPENFSECQDTYGTELSDSEPGGNDVVSKGNFAKTENENVDVVTIEDDFDVLQILKKEGENVTLPSSSSMIIVEDTDISDESESDEENGEKLSGSSAVDKKSERERKRRQQISELAEALRNSSPFFNNTTSLKGLLGAALVHIKQLEETEVRLKYLKYNSLCHRAQVLGRFRKLALEATPEVRKQSVILLLSALRSNNLLNPRVCGNATIPGEMNQVKTSVANSSVKFLKPLTAKPFSDDDGCNSKVSPALQENSEGDFKNCQKFELNQNNEGLPADLQKLPEIRRQVWNDSCRSRFTPIYQSTEEYSEQNHEIKTLLAKDGSVNSSKCVSVDVKKAVDRKQVWRDSCKSRFTSVLSESSHEIRSETSSPSVKDSSLNRRISVELKSALEGRSHGCYQSIKEEAPSNIGSATDSDISELNINPLVVDINETSCESKEKSFSKTSDSLSQRELNEQTNVNVHCVAEGSTKKEKVASKCSEATNQKNHFPGLIPLIDTPHIRKQVLESNRNISIRTLQSSSGTSGSEKILCQTKIWGSEDNVKRTVSLGSSGGNLTVAGVTSLKSVNSHALRNSNFAVGETKAVKDGSNNGAINFPYNVPQVKVESSHLRGILSSPSSCDIGVNMQIPSEARTVGQTAPPTYVPILSGSYGLQKVNLNCGKTVFAYEQKSRCDYTPSKNTTIRQIILPPPVSQVVKNQMNSVCPTSSASFECVPQSAVSVAQLSAFSDIKANLKLSQSRIVSTQPCTFPDIKTNLKLAQSSSVATQPCTFSDIKTNLKLAQSSAVATQPCTFSGIPTNLKLAQSTASVPQLCTFSGVTTDLKHAQPTVAVTPPGTFHGVITELTALQATPVTQPCIFPGVITDIKSELMCETKLSAALEPVKTESVFVSSGENVKHLASPSCDDVPVWVSAETGESCVVTRINSDEEEDSNIGPHCVSDEVILPVIVSCSTVSEERFYQGVDEENV